MKVHPILKISLVIVILMAVVLPLMYARAALVPCGTSENPQMCTLCDFFQLVDNVKNFLMVNVVTPLAVLFIVIGGVFILFAGASPANYARGKGIVTNTILGVFLIFSTWMITNTIIQLVAGDSNISRTWYSLTCSVGGVNVGGPTPTPTGPGTTPTPGGPPGASLSCNVKGLELAGLGSCSNNGIATCPDCLAVNGATKKAAKSLADLLNNKVTPAMTAAGVTNLYGSNDGMCPTGHHRSCAHFNGHAMDLNGGSDRNRIEKMCQVLNSLGVKGVSGLNASSRNVYIVENSNPRDTNPNSACPTTCGGAAGKCGRGLHIQN